MFSIFKKNEKSDDNCHKNALSYPKTEHASDSNIEISDKFFFEENYNSLENPTNTVPELNLSSVDRKKIKILIMVTLFVVTIFTVILGFDYENVLNAAKKADYSMLGIAFLFSLIPYYGASLALLAFTPKKIKLWDTIVMHIAGGVISLIAPAGLGIMALNVRFLHKHKISMALSVAIVIFSQTIPLFTLVSLILIACIVSSSYPEFSLPWGAIAIGVGFFVLVVLSIFAYPPFYNWFKTKLSSYYAQVKPLFTWVLKDPKRLLFGVLGSLIVTLGYATSFYFVLCAFTSNYSYASIFIAFVTANQVGSSLPSPGGIGGVELALSGALRIIGISTGIAVSTVLLYRVISFWIRIPLGWIALQYCQKKDLL